MTLTEKQRKELRRNWVAPAGSEEEKGFLDTLLDSGKLGKRELDYVRKWRDGDRHGAHFSGLMDVALEKNLKQQVMGELIYERAMKRHENLHANTWFVAYFISAGKKEKEMKEMLGLGDDGIRYHKDKIKQLILQEYNYELKSVKTEQISRWFLGL